MSKKKLILLVAALVTLSVAFLIVNKFAKDAASAKTISRIADSEKLILLLQRHLNDFSFSEGKLGNPDSKTLKLFEKEVSVKSLSDSEKGTVLKSVLDIESIQWPVSKESQLKTAAELSILKPVFTQTEVVKKFKLKLVRGAFQDSRNTFRSDVAISGLVELIDSGNPLSFEGSLEILWRKNEADWQISQWNMTKFSSQRNPGALFFVKANREAIPVNSEREAAERCIQDEIVVALTKPKGSINLEGGAFPFNLAFDTIASHPGISIVDINGDGWDDFYVIARWGRNKLFVNQGDGTFREQARDYGLNVLNHCTSAAFADFDNDGDPDLLLGRYYARSQYFENIDNHFSDVSHRVPIELPAMVTSVSVTDYNSDGLLDVFLTTYGIEDAARKFLSRKQQEILAEKSASGKSHAILNGLGVPNVLLVNKGQGKFEPAAESSQLELWQTTLSATWVDFDKDGDQDVYVSNDFGPDALMRNDFPDGFTEVTTEVGHPTMAGFGMGATWGDYDLDGKQDLYVSNMFSKAGMRITSMIENIDEQFLLFAAGNRLYRQSEKQFELTSGFEPPQHMVAKVGWSWGGQFADFDNDGFLDIYVPSGNFTAPQECNCVDDL